MKRSELKRCAEEIGREFEQKPYEYWKKIQLPLVFQKVFEGKEVNVEIVLLESTDEYLRLSICVDSGGLSTYLPAGYGIMVKKSSN